MSMMLSELRFALGFHVVSPGVEPKASDSIIASYRFIVKSPLTSPVMVIVTFPPAHVLSARSVSFSTGLA